MSKKLIRPTDTENEQITSARIEEIIGEVSDETLDSLFHKLGNTEPLEKYGSLTIGQCVALAYINSNTNGEYDAKKLATFYMLVMKDILRGELQARHPDTLISFTDYSDMVTGGMYRYIKMEPPFCPTGKWLVHFDKYKQWCGSKDFKIDFSKVPVLLSKLKKTELSTEQTLPCATDNKNDETNHDRLLADLFDPVTVPALEKMFSTNENKWKGWTERAARNGLKAARQDRAMFNPYLAGMWFLNKGVNGWDLARFYRVLANNLPERSLDLKHLLVDSSID